MTTKQSRTRSRAKSTGRPFSRPHSSLGFAGSSSSLQRIALSSSGSGFNVRDYFHQHGPSAELTLGINGRPSKDQTLLNYVQKCRVEALLDGVEDTRVGSDVSYLQQRTGVQAPVHAPLCWDTVLKHAEVYIYRHNCTHTHTQSHYIHIPLYIYSKQKSTESFIFHI